MSKWTELLAAASAVIEHAEHGGTSYVDRVPREQLERLAAAIAEAERPYDGTGDTHAAVWRCTMHTDCTFSVTYVASEVGVIAPDARHEVALGFLQHFAGPLVGFHAGEYAARDPDVVERIR